MKKLAVAFIVVYVSLVVFLYEQRRQLIIAEANERLGNILNFNKAIHTFVQQVQEPVIYKLQNEGKLYSDFFDPKLLSFTYVVRNIQQFYRQRAFKEGGVPFEYKLAATNPRNPLSKVTEFEAKILNIFRTTNAKEYSKVYEDNGIRYFYKAIPIDANKSSCMRCHSTPDKAPAELIKQYGDKAGFYEKVGDVRAMISLKIPVEHIAKTSFYIFILIATVLFLAFVGFYVLILKILKADKKLKEINNQLEDRVKEEVVKNLNKDRILQQQAKQASMGEMIGYISHQWKQPLNSLSLNIQNLKYDYDDNLVNQNFVDDFIVRNVDTINFMSKTINDFRNFYRVDKVKKVFSIKDAIEKTINIVKLELENHNITYSISGGDFNIDGFESEFQQVILNIISNAKDAILENQIKDGKIKIAIKNNSIYIADNAGGVPEDIMDKIFEPYFTTKSESKGTGIGLHMSKMIIVDSMGGKLKIYNKEDGAVFEIVL